MFGTIQVPMPELELSVEYIWKFATRHAATSLAKSRIARAKADTAFKAGDMREYGFQFDSFLTARGEAWATIAPIRFAIQDRTARETYEVAKIIEAGCAWFMQPACSTDECDKCERPWWHHIQVVGEGELCPMGRRFWQFARALMPSVMGDDRSDDRVLLSVIAAGRG